MGNMIASLCKACEENTKKQSAVVACHTEEEWRANYEASKQLNKLMVIDFSATWCGPCKFMEPVVDEFSNKYKDIQFIKIDVDELTDVAQEFDIEAMPTFVFLKNGIEIDRLVGAGKKELEMKIEKNKSKRP